MHLPLRPRPIMDDDGHMLCKILDGLAAQSIALKKKIASGRKLPSWAEYKIYKAGDSIKSAMASTFTMRDHLPRVSIMIKSAEANKEFKMNALEKYAAKQTLREGLGEWLTRLSGSRGRLNRKAAKAVGDNPANAAGRESYENLAEGHEAATRKARLQAAGGVAGLTAAALLARKLMKARKAKGVVAQATGSTPLELLKKHPGKAALGGGLLAGGTIAASN